MNIYFKNRSVEKLHIILLTVVIFIIRLPPVYIFPIKGAFFMTYNIARILIVFEFLLVVYTVIKEKSKLIEINKLTASLILIFFLTQGFSIVFSFNVQTFLFVYKDLVFALLLFLVAIHVVNKNNINFFLKIFIIASSIYLLFQIITYLFPNITYSILQPLFYDRYWQFFDFQFNRNKYFGDAFDEVTVAFALFYLDRKSVV